MKVGDEVICIDVANLSGSGGVKKGNKYIVDRVDSNTFDLPAIYVGIFAYGIEQPYAMERFKKIEPTNALSRELASKVIWEEMTRNPALQEQEINPKVFDLTTKF